jgi:hypothetical protein
MFSEKENIPGSVLILGLTDELSDPLYLPGGLTVHSFRGKTITPALDAFAPERLFCLRTYTRYVNEAMAKHVVSWTRGSLLHL